MCAVRLASADDSPRPPLFPMDKLYRVMGYASVCTIGRSAREGAAHTSSRDKDGRNNSRGETIVREREEGERKRISSLIRSSRRSRRSRRSRSRRRRRRRRVDAEHVCLLQKKRENQGRAARGRGVEWSRRNEAAPLVQKEKERTRIEGRRGAEKDGERARVRSGRN